MLLILCGTVGELGQNCRDYIQSKGYDLIEKYNYVEGNSLHEARLGERKYVSQKTFYEKTDSLFRYEIANLKVGFNWEQISDAVYKNNNRLLTCSPTDASMLRKIKEVYNDNVKIIYCFIETSALEGLNVKLSKIKKMTPAEFGSRMSIGLSIKENYPDNTDIFDAVIIYSGEGSVFDYDALYRQLDAVIAEPQKSEEDNKKRYDIFLSACQSDISHYAGNLNAEFVDDMIASLQAQGISVFQSWKDLKCGDNFNETIKESIKNSSVFLPIVSKDSLKSPTFIQELMFAVEAAKNSALIIKPISMDGATLPDFIGDYHAYNVRSESYAGSVNFIEDWFVSMFKSEATLKKLSDEIETCTKTGLFGRACELQSSYITTLHNHLSMWHKTGTAEKINAWIKYLNLSVQVRDFDKCNKTINSLLSEITEELDVSFYNGIAKSIADFCIVANTSADKMYERFYQFLCISKGKQQKFIKVFNTQYDILKHELSNDDEESSDIMLADKIAAYSNASVELFEALFKSGMAQGYQEALISAYNRIIDYCKTVSLGNTVTEKCIDRISELKASHITEVTETENGKKTLKSLKVYLGQALPDTGNYDVFISHKSADDVLADKVYEYLKNCGFEVFCDHHTLGELRDSNYDKRVMEALKRSKHLILVSSSPDYIKDGWVYNEWHHFYNDKRENRRNGNLIMVLSDDLLPRKSELPYELQDEYDIIKTSEFRDRINNYLW